VSSLQDHMAEAIARAFLACPLRCPHELWKHAIRVLRKRTNSRRQIQAMDNYRKAVSAWIARNADRLPKVLEALNDVE